MNKMEQERENPGKDLNPDKLKINRLNPASTISENSHYWKWLGIVLTVLLLVAASALYVYSQINQQKQSSNQAADELAGRAPIEVESWKTYHNEEYGFEFKYPNEWFIRDQESSSFKSIIVSNVKVWSPELSDESLQNEAHFQIDFFPNANPSLLPIEKWFDDYFKGGFANEPLIKITATFAGEPSIHTENAEIGRWAHNYVVQNQDTYDIHYRLDQTKFLDNFDQILSTFKFIEPETSQNSGKVEGQQIFDNGSVLLTYEDDPENDLAIYYTENGKKHLLINNVVKNFYADKQLIFYKTKLPDFVLVKNGSGDAGAFLFEEYYVNLRTKDYLSIKYSDSQELEIKDFSGAVYTITLAADGKCNEVDVGHGYIKLEGTVNLTGFKVNGERRYSFTPFITQKCGVPDYDPFPHFSVRGINSDLNRFFFIFSLINANSGSRVKEFNFSLNLFTLEVREDTIDSIAIY